VKGTADSGMDLWDEVFCQLFHARWLATVSYSRVAHTRCLKVNCRAQQRCDGHPAAPRLERYTPRLGRGHASVRLPRI